ncbi:MAG: hypothetical protein OEV89_13510 [Desulfobulbaceae bacterium]|nr:hypothetical protein [Desulfobulbaceae bacterium]HIJ91686.1 hypothetical protein [Deltaproteobacteria bacterium]
MVRTDQPFTQHGVNLAKPNYQYEKRQRELAKKKKKEEKKQNLLEKKELNPESETDQPLDTGTD